MKTHMKKTLGAGLALALVASTGCSDLFSMQNPGLIEDATLESPAVFTPLVNGIAGDMAQAMNVARSIAEMSFEMQTSGPTVEPWSAGVFEPAAINAFWTPLQKARWVAVDGVRRMKTNMAAAYFAKSALVAEAQLY